MRQWRPEERELLPPEPYTDVRWGGADGGVALGMVVGLDGGVTIDGLSGELGGPADRAAFRALRAAADAILVGAGTVRAENYGPPVRRDDVVAARRGRGQPDLPTLAIVTASLSIATDHRVFADADNPPTFVTATASPADRQDQLEAAGANLLRSGEDAVDLAGAIDRLRDRGCRQILCEGGPSLNTSLLAAGLVDELFVTLAPTVTGSGRHLVTPQLPSPVELELVGVIAAGSELLLRYRVSR